VPQIQAVPQRQQRSGSSGSTCTGGVNRCVYGPGCVRVLGSRDVARMAWEGWRELTLLVPGFTRPVDILVPGTLVSVEGGGVEGEITEAGFGRFTGETETNGDTGVLVEFGWSLGGDDDSFWVTLGASEARDDAEAGPSRREREKALVVSIVKPLEVLLRAQGLFRDVEDAVGESKRGEVRVTARGAVSERERTPSLVLFFIFVFCLLPSLVLDAPLILDVLAPIKLASFGRRFGCILLDGNVLNSDG
jgi:hypothetical protein